MQLNKTDKLLRERSMTNLIQSIILTILYLVAIPAYAVIDTSKVVGKVEGGFQVAPDGAAGYNIPISVPPGVGQMQPTLSIIYNSKNKNGLLGVGWSFTGTSSISRCSQTFAQDGRSRGVNLDYIDRLCLDGQRLVAVSGAYGADGTEYRTEIDSFIKVTGHGNFNSASSWFEAKTKSGQTFYYGATEDSRANLNGISVNLAWEVSEISDVVNNKIQFSYNENVSAGYQYPAEFSYTSVTGQPVSIKVVYEGRPDTFTGFAYGAVISEPVRMSGLEIYVSGALQRSYKLSYETAPVTGNSRMTTILECSGNNTCLPPTTFRWENNTTAGYNSETWPVNPAWGAGPYTWAADFNNDGITDIASANGGSIYMHRSTGSSFTNDVMPVANLWGTGWFTWASDFNGDGLVDIASASGTNVFMKINTGNGFRSETWPVEHYWGGDGYNWAVDVNGDGRTDIVSAYHGDIHVKLSTGSGFEKNKTYQVAFAWGGGDYTWTADFNGDGLIDIASAYGGNVYMKLNTGNGFRSETWPVNNLWGSSSVTWAEDFNGDGLPDIVSANGTNVYLKINTGRGFTNKVWTIAQVWGGAGYNWQLDYNGDGLPDIISAFHDTIYININKGTHFENQSTKVAFAWGGGDYTKIGDFNGDGNMDLASAYAGSIYMKLGMKNPRADLLANISSGFGNTTSINYKPMTNSTVYTKSCIGLYPVNCIEDTSQLVSSYTANNGIGGTARYEYKYSNKRIHVRGRGNLGYASVTVNDTSSGVRIVSLFDNYTGVPLISGYPDLYPYNGMVRQTTTYKDNEKTTSTSNTPSYISTYAGLNTPIFAYYATGVVSNYEGRKTRVSQTNTWNYYDGEMGKYGNPTKIVISTTDSQSGEIFTKETVNQYDNDPVNWILGRLRYTKVTDTAYGDIKSRESWFDYYPNGLLQETREEQNDAELRLVTRYTYDAYGNKKTITVEGGGSLYPVPARTTTSYYSDANGAESTTATEYITTLNALGHTETKQLDSYLGVSLSLIGPNGLKTTWQHDDFGRKIGEIRADGNTSSITREWCLPSLCPPNAIYSKTSKSSGSAPVTEYLDRLNRVVRTETKNINGLTVYQDTEYDAQGRVSRSSDAYFAGSTPNWSTNDSYDALGRITQTTDITGTVTEFSYQGLTTSVTVTPLDGAGTAKAPRTSSSKTYVTGKQRLATDAEGGITEYFYYADGNLKQVNAPGSQLSMTYDRKGNKIGMIDPDMGTWSYVYDALGQLRRQEDARGNVTRIKYDLLGRKILTMEREGLTAWQYDTAQNKGIGKLHYMAGHTRITLDQYEQYKLASTALPDINDIVQAEPWYKVYHSYDHLGRRNKSETFYAATPTTPLSMETVYDDTQYGRVKQLIYPVNIQNERMVLNYTYDEHLNDYGYLTKIKRSGLTFVNLDSTTGLGEWQPITDTTVGNIAMYSVWSLGDTTGNIDKAINVRSQIEEETYGVGLWVKRKYNPRTGLLEKVNAGNSLGLGAFGSTVPSGAQSAAYVFDSIGSLEVRTDYLPDPNDTTRSPLVETYAYDKLNRLKSDSLTGLLAQTGAITTRYDYDASGNIRYKSDMGYYHYGGQGTSAGPHALTHISSDAAGSNTLSTYNYDLNGNMVGANNRRAYYSSFNKLLEVQTLTSNGSDLTYFSYNGEHNRYRKLRYKFTAGGIDTIDTYYLDIGRGNHFERQRVNGVATSDTHHLYAGGKLIGTYTVKSSNARQTRYFLKDHLGSTSVIADEGGNARAKVGFSAFGEWRDSMGLTLNQVYELDGLTEVDNTRWYTGHEQLDDVGLIHMNGRMYDPKLGRFLSADPFIQAPDNSQSYNRYSYVFNNPLSHTDPSGYFSLTDVVRAGLKYNMVTGWAYTRPVRTYFQRHENARTAGFIAAGAADYYIAGGTPVFSSAYAWYIADITGGDPWEAAVVAGATSYASYGVGGSGWAWYTKVFWYGVIGGTVSKHYGGEFEQGFKASAAGSAVGMGLNARGVYPAISASVAGGVSAELGGGKFKNGAAQGAFAYAVSGMFAQEEETTRTISKGQILYERGDASVLVKNNERGGRVPAVMETTIEHALDVSQAEGKLVMIISGWRSNSSGHQQYGAIDVVIEGYTTEQVAMAFYKRGHFNRVSSYTGRLRPHKYQRTNSAHADYKTTGRNQGLFEDWVHQRN